MRLTLNKFSIIFILTTSVLPILGLGFIHINYLHQILNEENKSFLTLIEHEEFNLFLIYLGFVFSCLILSLLYLKNLVIKPLINIANKLDQLSKGITVENIPNSKKYFYEIQEFIQEFNQTIQALQIAKRQRNDFIATLTHDLRVPLLAEKKAFELLREYKLDTESHSKILDSLIHSNDDLLNLINLLLDSYKFEEGLILINKREIKLSELIDKSLLSLYPLIQEKNIKISTLYEQRGTESVKVNLDEAQFSRVLNNILLNAIQNSPHQSSINIQLISTPELIELSIADDGYGIDKNKIDKIFDRYASGNELGTGLGLYISKLIIEAHQGELFVKNKDPNGVEFIIKLKS